MSDMKISIRPYMRRDGSPMVYINNDRKVSIGLSEERGYQSTKATEGQKKLWDAFWSSFSQLTPIADGAKAEMHTEWKLEISRDTFFAITDTATVGGVNVESDGLYVVHKGQIYPSRGEDGYNFV